MPLIMNGTTIPTNVANVLNYNGTNITSVIFNGTNVWTQSLQVLNNGWSGSSMSWWGFQTSGFSYRLSMGGYNTSWASVSNMAIFGSTNYAFSGSDTYMIEGSGNSFRIRSYSKTPSFITFNTSTKTFTSTSSIVIYEYSATWYSTWYFEISGNSIRIKEQYPGMSASYFPWISLT